ncbi:helix-turn-helix domain-containing protein [Streptomyces sp. NPDC054883]
MGAERPRACRAPAGRGIGALLGPLVRTVAAQPGTYPAAVGRLGGHLADLLGAVVEELSQGGPGDGDREFMNDIRWYVNARLGDPALCPQAIAAAHFISVRRLHELFADGGTTVGRWIRRRRLQEARRRLRGVGAGGGPPKVATVAQHCGFANPAHFSRAFREAYGVSPSDWQRVRTDLAPLRPAARGGRPAAAAGR